jgi:hypothetical protein
LTTQRITNVRIVGYDRRNHHRRGKADGRLTP